MEHCPNCGGAELEITAAIRERSVIDKILTRLGRDPQPPPRESSARRRTGLAS